MTEPDRKEDSEGHGTESSTTPVKKTHAQRLKRLVLFLFSVYAGLCVMLMIIQRRLIYFPTRESSLAPADLQLPTDRFHQITVRSTDGLILHGWHLLPPGRSALDEKERQWELELGRPVILFFPGNAGNRRFRIAELKQLSQLNADVFLIDYRGYGDNSGVPSEENFAQDARAVWDHLTENESIAPMRILILGESLGGGVAVRLVHELLQEEIEPGGLFLKTTFSSLVDVAQTHYPWIPCSLLMSERYPSDRKIGELTCPISILHGIQDEIVPIELALRLFEAAPEKSSSNILKTFIELPTARHNDVVQVAGKEYLDAVATMMQAIRR